jgi:beta-glucanase (GH16 family)
MPSRRPAVSEEVTTEVAPDCSSRWRFSSSRTAATIEAFGASSRAVSVVSTALSSRSVATMTARARSTRASRSVAVRVESPTTTV